MAAAVSRRGGGQSLDREYERHRGAVMRMLGKRYPRLDDDDRLSIYHDAWARLLSKRERGERIESLRAYLLATCAAEALHIVSRPRRATPVGPAEPLFANLPDGGASVEEQVVIRDQARVARDLIDSLDRRQREVLKLRWDLQLDGSEVRAALGLTRRQYQRLSEEGAAAIVKRVEELEDGTWSRRQRSLLTACLVSVTADGERRRGIASERQRKEAQRLLESDPHFAALLAEIRETLGRATVLLPLPVLLAGDEDAFAATGVAEVFADLRDRVAEVTGAVKHQVMSAYVRAADPAVLAGPRPGTVVAALAASVAVGGGAFGAYEAVSKPAQPSVAPLVRPSSSLEPLPASNLPGHAAVGRLRAESRPKRRSEPDGAVNARTHVPPPSPLAQPPPAPAPTSSVPAAPTHPPQPTTAAPEPDTTSGREFSFEN